VPTMLAASGMGLLVLVRLACCAQHVLHNLNCEKHQLEGSLAAACLGKSVVVLRDCSACCFSVTDAVLQSGMVSDQQASTSWPWVVRQANCFVGYCPGMPWLSMVSRSPNCPTHCHSLSGCQCLGLARQGTLQGARTWDCQLAAAVGAGDTGVSPTDRAALMMTHQVSCWFLAGEASCVAGPSSVWLLTDWVALFLTVW
jgi:hypothetical protein